MGREKPWRKWKDDELVVEGFNREGEAMVEMMRRLKWSTEFLSVVNIFLTVVLVALTAALVFPVAFHRLFHSS